MDNLHRDKDIIVSGAFTKTISEQGPNGSNEIWTLANHYADFKAALGKPSEIYEEGDMLISVTKILDTEMGEDIIKLYNAGVINQHSIGFSVIQSSDKGEYREIKECKLWEGGPVLWGANQATPTLELSKSFKSAMEVKNNLANQLEKLHVAFKHGNFRDETFSLLAIQIKQIQTEILKFTTPAVEETLEPGGDEILKALRETNLKLKKLL